MKNRTKATPQPSGAKPDRPTFTLALAGLLTAGLVLLTEHLSAQVAPKTGTSPATVDGKGKNLRPTRENPTVNVSPVTVIAPSTSARVKPVPGNFTLIKPAAVLNRERIRTLRSAPGPTAGQPDSKFESQLPKKAGTESRGQAPGDFDGDGRKAEAAGGDDCDDRDPHRFPGNSEVCDPLGKDEDCDPATCGNRDLDRDGFVDVNCFNVNSAGEITSQGTDCDDNNPAIYPGAMRYIGSETEVEVCGAGIYRVEPTMRIVSQPNGTVIIVPR